MKKTAFLAFLMLVISAPVTWAGFINGGFEDGNFTGWNLSGGFWYGDKYDNSVNPMRSGIVSKGTDPYTNNQLQMVAHGNYAARINNFDWGWHYSTISQTVVWNDPAIYFEWAAVLQEPLNLHPESSAPHFALILKDNTTGNTLYDTAFNVYNAPNTGIEWHDGSYDKSQSGRWRYCDWQQITLDTSGVMGHQLTLTLLASDCAWMGHGGYAYLDAFSAVASNNSKDPGQNHVPVPDSVVLLGTGLGLMLIRKFR